MPKRVGFEGKLYRGTAGSTASDEVTGVTDVNYTVDADRADTSTRASIWKFSKVAMLSLSIDFTMKQDETDSDLTALKAAAVAGTPIALRTRDYASGYGVDADFNITFQKGEPLNGEQTVQFTAEPTDESSRTPTWS